MRDREDSSAALKYISALLAMNKQDYSGGLAKARELYERYLGAVWSGIGVAAAASLAGAFVR